MGKAEAAFEQAMRDGAEMLNLSDLRLEALPGEIGGLTGVAG